MNNKYTIFIFGALLLSFCSFMVFKLTTYFYVDSGYIGVLANQQNYKLIKVKLDDNKKEEAIDYIDLLIDSNDKILEAALSEGNLSASSRKRIAAYLEEKNN